SPRFAVPRSLKSFAVARSRFGPGLAALRQAQVVLGVLGIVFAVARFDVCGDLLVARLDHVPRDAGNGLVDPVTQPAPDGTAVELAAARLQLRDPEILVEDLAQRGASLSPRPRVDAADEPGQHPLGRGVRIGVAHQVDPADLPPFEWAIAVDSALADI